MDASNLWFFGMHLLTSAFYLLPHVSHLPSFIFRLSASGSRLRSSIVHLSTHTFILRLPASISSLIFHLQSFVFHRPSFVFSLSSSISRLLSSVAHILLSSFVSHLPPSFFCQRPSFIFQPQAFVFCLLSFDFYLVLLGKNRGMTKKNGQSARKSVTII